MDENVHKCITGNGYHNVEFMIYFLFFIYFIVEFHNYNSLIFQIFRGTSRIILKIQFKIEKLHW